VSWTIDTRVPVVTIQSDRPATTNATSMTFTFSADKSPVSFACQLDGAALAACSSPTAYSGLSQTTHTFFVQATDSVANVGKATYTWTIDTTPPRTTITSGPQRPTTTATSATFAFASNEGGVTFTCKLDSFRPTLCASPKLYSGLTAGSHTFAVNATDAAGNVGPAATYGWTIQSVPPG